MGLGDWAKGTGGKSRPAPPHSQLIALFFLLQPGRLSGK